MQSSSWEMEICSAEQYLLQIIYGREGLACLECLMVVAELCPNIYCFSWLIADEAL
jgi:hypothetical protein